MLLRLRRMLKTSSYIFATPMHGAKHTGPPYDQCYSPSKSQPKSMATLGSATGRTVPSRKIVDS